ncbi:MAG TPA: mechanosensitive ion channel domain-containing protein [Acidobacteriota bacterium]|nr:mechanosensitive ion channel domain-containing protein [Acidobacteriota bacterium]
MNIAALQATGVVAAANTTNESVLPLAADAIVGSLVTKFLWALLILFCGIFLGKLVQRLIHKVLLELEVNKFIEQTTHLQIRFDEIIASFLGKLIYIFAILIALNSLGVTSTIINILSIGVMALALILIVLGIKDFIPNLISGIILHKKRYLAEGDSVEIDRIKGTVTSFELLETQVQTKNGDILHIPNSYLIKSKIRIKSPKIK